MEEREDGISLGEIFHVMLIKKWLLLGISVAVMIIGILALMLVYNPSAEYYEVEYELKFNGYSSGKYPDGTDIIMYDFISLETLEEVKTKDERFANIDVAEMVEENDIIITKNYETINDEEVEKGTMTVKVLKKYFSNNELAKDFLTTLVSYPVDYALNAIYSVDHKYNLTQSQMAGNYKTQLNYLIAQRDMLINNYDNLTNSFSTGYVVDGKTIADAKSEVVAYFSQNNLESMLTEIELNGYVKTENSDFLETIKRDVANLEREYDLNENKLTALNESLDDLITKYQASTNSSLYIESLKTYNDQIAALTLRNVEIRYTIDVVYAEYLKSENASIEYQTLITDFESRLEKYHNKLVELTDAYIKFNNTINLDNAKVVYSNSSKIKGDGGISVIIGAVVFLVVGAVVGGCVNLVLDMPKYIKKKKEEASLVETPETTKN